MTLNLFAAAEQAARKDVLLEFKAGCMNKDDNSNWVRPDTRKGLIQLRLSPDGDGLIYFQWRDRTTGSVGLELTIFPGEAVWKRVKECTTGRVYVLEFTANKKLYFFWLQEPKEDKDEEYEKKMNQYLKEPPRQGHDLLQLLSQSSSQNSRSESTAESSSAQTQTTQSSANNVSSSSAAGQVDMSQALRNILSGIKELTSNQEPKGPSLQDVLRTDDILATGVLNDKEVQKELQQHLPPEEEDTVIKTLRTPQFRQAVDALDAALSQGHLPELLSSLGLQPSPREARNNVEAFLNAIQQQAEKELQQKESKQSDDDKMDTS